MAELRGLLDRDEDLRAWLARMTSPPEPYQMQHDFRLGDDVSARLKLQGSPQGTGYGLGAAPPITTPSAQLNLGPLSLNGGLAFTQRVNEEGNPSTRMAPNFGAGMKVPLPGDATAEGSFNLTPNELLQLEAAYRRKVLGGDLSVTGTYGQPLGAMSGAPPSWGANLRWSRGF